MKKEPFNELLDSAVRELRESGDDNGLRDFERRVWTEIALHEESRWSWFADWLREGKSPAPKITAIGCTVAVAIGITYANFQTKAYRKVATKTMEQRYVATIHPVLRSVELAEKNHSR